MYLFIFESIGTSELILVGIVALIFLGPRKLPELARKAGKILSEFRGTASEFRETWKREVDFEEEAKAFDINALDADPIAETDSSSDHPATTIAAPAIKEIDPARFEHLKKPGPDDAETAPNDNAANDKSNWL